MSRENNFKQVVSEMLRELNGVETEEVLISMITSTLVERSTVSSLFEQRDIVAYTVTPEQDDNNKVEKGVFVYCNNSLVDWSYERFDTIADAIRRAVKCINAYIICNGEIINYDALDEYTAYYYSGEKMKLVMLGE